MENNKREELRKRLNNKLQQKKILRSAKEIKEEVFRKDENLSKLGINNKKDLERFMDSIKDIDKSELMNQLLSMGLQREQIDQFFKMFRK